MVEKAVAVLISMQPKWYDLIASGKKMVEVRKTRPSIGTPLLCYIYECGNNGRKKIIGEFVCDKITRIFECCDVHDELPNRPCEYYLDYAGDDDIPVMACLSVDEIWHYIGKEGIGYVWHILNLKIYDTPKELSEFKLTRPPQSWRYVEVME